MTIPVIPPEGTASDTYHWIKASDGTAAVYLWQLHIYANALTKNEVSRTVYWERCGSEQEITPEELGEGGFTYYKPCNHDT